MSPWRNNFDLPRSRFQRSSKTSWASKKYSSLNSRMPSWTGSRPAKESGAAIGGESDESRINFSAAGRSRFVDDEPPDFSVLRTRVCVPVLLAEDGNGRCGRGLAVRQDFDARTAGEFGEHLFGLDERVRAQETAGIDRAGRSDRLPQEFRLVHGDRSDECHDPAVLRRGQGLVEKSDHV